MNFHARKKRLVQTRLQVRMTGAFLALSALGLVFQAFLLKRSLVAAGAKADSATELLQGLPTQLGVNVMLTLCALGPLMALVGIYITHRVAGPAVRMENHLREWIAGEQPEPCQLRRSDELQGLCDLLNDALSLASAQQADEERTESARESTEQRSSGSRLNAA